MFSNDVREFGGERTFKLRKKPRVNMYKKPQINGTYVYFYRGGNIEVRVCKKLVALFRKKIRRRKFKLKFMAEINYTVTSKGSSSRMGKGKGALDTHNIRLPTNKLFMIVTGLDHHRLLFFFKNFYRSTRIRFIVIKKKIY